MARRARAREVQGEDYIGTVGVHEPGGEARVALGEGLAGTAVARDEIVPRGLQCAR